MPAAPSELFSGGTVAGTLALSALEELAAPGEQGSRRALELIRTHGLFESARTDDGFFELLDSRVPLRDEQRPSEFERQLGLLALGLAEESGSAIRPKLLVKVAEAELQLGNVPCVERLTRRALIDPSYSSDPRYERRWRQFQARCAYARGEFDDALPALREAADAALAASEVRSAWSMLVDAVACTNHLGRSLEALERCDELIRLADRLDEPRARSVSLGQRGITLLHLGRIDDAKPVFEAALSAAVEAADERRQSDWWGDLGLVHILLDQPSEAIRCHERALGISKSIGDLDGQVTDLRHLAAAHRQAGEDDAATQCLREVIGIRERSGDETGAAEARDRLRELYLQLGRIGAAQSLELDSTLRAAALTQAAVAMSYEPAEEPVYTEDEQRLESEFTRLVQTDQTEAAHQMLERFASENPTSPVLHFLRGRLLRMTDRPAEAEPSYRRALELCPRWGLARVEMVLSAANAGRLDDMLARCSAAVRDEPYDALGHTALGLCLGLRGDREAALRELREARRLAPTSYTAARYLVDQLFANAVAALAERDKASGWAVFDECVEVLDQLPELSEHMRPEACLTAARMRIRFAEESTKSGMDLDQLFNPRQRFSTPALQLLAQAIPPALTALRVGHGSELAKQLIARVLRHLLVMPEPVSMMRAGAWLRQAGELDFAKPLLKAAFDLEPSDQAHYELALLLADEDPHSAEAERLLARAVELQPANPDYQSALRQLRSRRSR